MEEQNYKCLLSTKEKQQANFYIIRQLWQVICGRKKTDESETVYDAFNIGRKRYTRLVNGDNTRLGKKELESLVYETGISVDVFTGNTLLHLNGIKDKDWQNFIRARKDIQADKYGYNIYKSKIDSAIQAQAKADNRNDSVFFNTCFYIRKGQRFDENKQREDQLNHLIDILEQHTIPWLSVINSDVLGKYSNALKQQYEYTNAILVVKHGFEME